MKKTFLASLALCLILVLVLCGCQAALVSSNVTIQADGSGVKTITAVIYSDDAILAGQENAEEPGLVGNNSKFLLVSGDDLVNKLKSYSGLQDLEITTADDNGNTVVTITYAFDSIDDYVAKTKLLAGDDADSIEAPTFEEQADGTFVYRENTQNTQNSLDNIFESLYNDPEAFSQDGQGDCDLAAYGYDYTCIYTIMSVSATVGDETTTVDVNEYNDSNTVIELDWADYIEVTGAAAAPAAEEAPVEEAPAEEAPAAEASQGLSTGAIAAIAAVCVVIVAAVVIVLTKKKKNA